MKAARAVPPLLAGATLILLCSNALPTVHRRHRLLEERNRVQQELREGDLENVRLMREIRALRDDPFYVERLLVRTWRERPEGSQPFADGPDPEESAEVD